MPTQLSVIIPTLNCAHKIGPLLQALYDGDPISLISEVIIVDGGSNDNIKMLADNIEARFITAPKGRGSQLSAGAQAANGHWFYFVHADTRLPDDWANHINHHINHETKAAYAKLSFDAIGFAPRFVAKLANFRASVLGLPYGDQTLLISRKLYDEIGGYPDTPLMEDVAIIRKLHRRLKPLHMTIETSADRYEQSGWMRRSCQNLWTLIQYLCGKPPAKLVRRYNR